MAIPAIVVIFVQCIWGTCEFVIYRKMKSTEDNADQNSYKVLYRITLGSLFLGIFIGNYLQFNNLFGLYNSSIDFPIAGTCFIILGLVIRLLAINQLKKFFTINVAIRDDHKLIHGGMYRYIRHPAYLGGILSFIGCGLCYGNIISFMVIAIPYLILILQRIKAEEAVLVHKFGTEYIEMMEKTKKLIPYLF